MSPPRGRRARSHRPGHDARSRSLATAALRIVDADGLDALTIRRLASDVGMTPMAIYRYFADKDALLGAVCGLIDEEIRAGRPDDAPATGESAPEWLSELMGRAVRVLTSHHPDLTVLIQSRLGGEDVELYTDQVVANLEVSLEYLAQLGITGLGAVQLSFLLNQGVFMLALACRGDGDGPDSADARLRARWEALCEVSPERFPRVREAAAAVARAPIDAPPTLLEQGIGLFASALRDGDEHRAGR